MIGDSIWHGSSAYLLMVYIIFAMTLYILPRQCDEVESDVMEHGPSPAAS